MLVCLLQVPWGEGGSKRLVTILMILILAFKTTLTLLLLTLVESLLVPAQSSTTLVFKILDGLWMNSVALLGEYGVGKTVLLQAALRNLKKKGIKVKSIYKQFVCILHVYDLKVILISTLDNGWVDEDEMDVDGVLEILCRYLLDGKHLYNVTLNIIHCHL